VISVLRDARRVVTTTPLATNTSQHSSENLSSSETAGGFETPPPQNVASQHDPSTAGTAGSPEVPPETNLVPEAPPSNDVQTCIENGIVKYRSLGRMMPDGGQVRGPWFPVPNALGSPPPALDSLPTSMTPRRQTGYQGEYCILRRPSWAPSVASSVNSGQSSEDPPDVEVP
jgi:hypothetical protein